MNQPDLSEDSDDLTDDEVKQSIDVPDIGALAVQVRELICGVGGCELASTPTRHCLRRRKPVMYWRIHACCSAGHNRVLVFRASWLPVVPGE